LIDGEVGLFGSELAGGDVFHVFIEYSLLLWTFGDLFNSILPRIHHPHIFFPSLGSDRQQLAVAQQFCSETDAFEFILGAVVALMPQFGIFYWHYYKSVDGNKTNKYIYCHAAIMK